MSDRRKINLSLKNNGSENKSILLLLFRHSLMSNSLWPHGLKHARPPCPLPPPGACSNSCPLCQWCHPTFLSSYIHLNSFLDIFLLLTSRRKWGKCISYIYIKWKWSHSVMSNSLWSHGSNPWTYQDSQSMGFSRQEYWSGLPFPSPGDLPNSGIELKSPAL